jgi:hypothetical protein
MRFGWFRTAAVAILCEHGNETMRGGGTARSILRIKDQEITFSMKINCTP